MQKSKKNVVGLAGACRLSGGVHSSVSKDLNVKIVVSFLPIITVNNSYKTVLFGLKSGCWSARLLKHLAGTATYL